MAQEQGNQAQPCEYKPEAVGDSASWDLVCDNRQAPVEAGKSQRQ